MSKTLLKVASGINFAIGGLILAISLLILSVNSDSLLGNFCAFGAIIRLLIGTSFLSVAIKNEDELINSGKLVLVTSIASILFGHIISFILGLVSYIDINRHLSPDDKIKRKLTEEEKVQKRLRSLLALGCGLVILAGVIFAMTTWTTLSGAGKTVALIVSTLIFFGLSYFAENKFNLKISAVTYYILANVSCLFAFVSAGSFGIFGEWFSLEGQGGDLYKAFLFLITGVLTYLTYIKYNKFNLFYIMDFSVIMIMISLLSFVKAGKDIIIFSMIAVLGIFALVSYENVFIKKANNFSKALFPIASFIFLDNMREILMGDNIIFTLISFAIAFVVVYYLAIVNKSVFYQIFGPIFTIVAAFMLNGILGAESKIMFLQLMLVTLVTYLVGFYKRDQKCLFTTTSIVCDLAFLYIFIDALNMKYNYYAIAAGIALLGTSVTAFSNRKFGQYYFEKVLEPIKVILLSYAVYKLLYNFEYVEEALFLGLVGFVFSVICVFRKDFMKSLYFVGSIVLVVWTMFFNAREFSPIVQSLSIVSFLVLLIITFKSKNPEFSKCREFLYGLLLISIAFASLNIFTYFGLKLIGIILLSIIYSILFVIFNKNDIFRCFTIIALLIPYIVILPISVWNEEINYIFYSLPWLALIFVYTRGFLATANLKFVNVIESIILSIWYLVVISEIALEVAIFIGLFSFFAILVGYRNGKWSSLYYTGVVFLILNTLVQLKELWTSIPMWAYMLLAGLILIGIVSYKEYTRNSKKDMEENIEPKMVENNEIQSQNVDVRAIVAGSILYAVFIPIFLQIIL